MHHPSTRLCSTTLNDATGFGKIHYHYESEYIWKAEGVYEEYVCPVFLTRADVATCQGVDTVWG